MMRAGLRRNMLIAFLLVSLVPLCISAAFIFLNARKMESTMASQIRGSLDIELRRRLELRARETADAVRGFLIACEGDLHSLSLVPRTDAAYSLFALSHKSAIWEGVADSSGTRDSLIWALLYTDIAYVDTEGNELIRVVNGRPVMAHRNVLDPSHTTYKSEDYFRSVRDLPPGEVYVSHVSGWHVSRREGSPGGPEDPPRYAGVIRFARGVFNPAGRRIGVIVLSLDHRHVMEYIQHIDPLADNRVAFPRYATGNYAFLFDDEGWIIAHPNPWDIRGLDSLGRLVLPYTEESTDQDVAAGRIPINLFRAGFIHENYPKVAADVLAGKWGSVVTVNVGKIARVLAYAPVFYASGRYRRHGVFGGVTIGAEAGGFHKPADVAADSIDQIFSFSLRTIYILMALTAVGALFVSFGFSERLITPLKSVVRHVQALAAGELSQRVNLETQDEIGDLAQSVNRLSLQLEAKQQRLDESFSQLEHRLTLLEQIQQVSDLLGTTFELEAILPSILRVSVEGMHFDRAILYLLSEDQGSLEYRDSYGFTQEAEAGARKAPLRIGVDECVETRVIKERRLIYVENIKDYPRATPLDHSIRERLGSRAFAFAPLMVQEHVIGILGVGRFKTDQRITEIELHSLQILANHAARVIEMSRLYGEISEDRAFLDGIFQSTLAGIIVVDPSGNIKSLNGAAEKLLHTEGSHVLGKPLPAAFSADAEAQILVGDIADWGRRHGSFELKYNRGKNARRLYLTASQIFSETHEHLGLIIVLQDLTERKQFEEHVSRVERLASMGRLAAGVAHEIRNPLTGLSLILDDLHDRSTADPSMQGQIRGALEVVERIDALVTQLLAHASPNRQVVQPCDVNQIIDQCVAFVKNQARKSQVDVQVELDRSIQPLPGDPQRLSQAVLNVVLNALQSMPDGGILRISTSEVFADLETKRQATDHGTAPMDSSIIITISDTGPGVPPDMEQKIFEPFFTTKPEGTGLGLYITHQIITDHAGEIFVSPNGLRGARFSIFLPRVQRSARTLRSEVL